MEGHHQRWKAGKRGVDDGGVNCRSEGIVTKGSRRPDGPREWH